ncbi:DUF5691 domain-containing protein [Nocardia sp. NPDC056000]|uniref:SWIM zinc finger family protein n=1 Tax=Nocardia sp. NPDC056000 TaxID=3345674 RepID=UPI0035D696D1
MTTAWTADQIAALAPDATSLTAARKLRGKWNGTGRHDTALWGLCQGSGGRPYQTVVDTAGPAYKCSCPSRKFPCKHALSLMLAWSEGEIPATDTVADFAGEWLAGRAARETDRAARDAKKAASESNSPTTTTPAGSATADQRRALVTAGLADLDIWLTDQIRTGLASADRSMATFESVAKRMVDAKAPGVAAVLRQLPRTATHSDWPRLLLREYARLHLLATAHRRLDTLSPTLAASVRTHIGYQTGTESVRATPPVRDTWMVLGTRITNEEAIYTRRIWLLGRQSGRWALLIDHKHGGPGFPQDTPPPGFMIDADLHFYPGANPLRALWGTRHGLPDPFTTIPNSERTWGIDAALTAHARAVGADPFLRSWPVLLTGVVPARDESGWYIAESDGTALPIAADHGEPWQLLGLSGGHPVGVIGEWTADGLIPVAALLDGTVINIDLMEATTPAAPPSSTESQAGSAELVSAALIGTARRPANRDELAAPVAALAHRLGEQPDANSAIPPRPGESTSAAHQFGEADPAVHQAAGETSTSGGPGKESAAVLLESAALQDCFARGGVGALAVDLPAAADDDQRLRLSVAASARLAELLSTSSPFLDEWLAAAEERELRAPDALVSVLLDRAKALALQREPLLRLAGARGRWLAAQHPGWRALVRADVRDDSVWSHGRAAERRVWLAQLRRRDPIAARDALAGTWGTESGPGKAELLAVFADGLSLMDEALLETALDDRRAEVRRTAADLLGRLQDSHFAGRMTERAAAWLTFGRKLRRPELTTTGPGVLDDAARRDGVGDPYGYTVYRADGAPDLAAEWLHRVVAATPLSHWERVLGPPEQAVRAAMTEAMRGPMFAGWADAALAQRNPAWARELFAAYAAQEEGGSAGETLRELFALQPLADQIRHLCRLDSSWLAEIESLLRAMPHPWPGPMAEHVLRLLLERAQLSADRPGTPNSLRPASYRTLFRAASAHFPVDTADMVTAIARKCGDPYWEQAFDQLTYDLTQRRAMLEELK